MSQPKHICLLTSRQTKSSSFAPQHPSARWHDKLFNSFRRLLLLNENDARSKAFLRTGSALRAEQRNHSRGPYWYIIHPFSRLNLFIENMFLVTLLHRMTFSMTMMKNPQWYVVSSRIRDVLHTIFMVSFFFTGYVDHHTKQIFIKTSETVKHYLFTYFIVDLFMLVEDNSDTLIYKLRGFLNKYLKSTVQTKQAVAVPITTIALICYIIRLRSCMPTIGSIFLNFGCGRLTIFIVKHLVICMFILNLFTFLLYDIPYNIYLNNNYFPNNSWVILRNQSFERYNIDTYIESLLLVISHFFGAYHYDVITQPCEQLLLFIFTFCGRGYTLVIIGRILSKFGISDRAETEYENMLVQLYSFMNSLEVPAFLQDQVSEKFEYNYQKKFFNSQQMMKVLTSHLKKELMFYEAKKLISINNFLKLLKAEELEYVLFNMKYYVYSSNAVLVDKTQTPHHIFFILSGTVAVFVGNTEVFHLQDGDLFNVNCIFADDTSEFEMPIYVMTLEPTEICTVHIRHIKFLMETDNDVFRYFNSLYVERLQLITDAYKRQKTGHDARDLLKSGVLLERRRKRVTVNVD